jgi:hypothetical protein
MKLFYEMQESYVFWMLSRKHALLQLWFKWEVFPYISTCLNMSQPVLVSYVKYFFFRSNDEDKEYSSVL